MVISAIFRGRRAVGDQGAVRSLSASAEKQLLTVAGAWLYFGTKLT